MKKIVLSLIILSGAVNGFSQGLKLDAEKYNKLDQWTPPEKLGFSSSSLPANISYRKYCPGPKLQSGATCVGWSSAYAAYSTQTNIQMNITNNYQKWARAFDPNFIYNFIRKADDFNCEKGSLIYNALETLETYGCKPHIWEPWIECADKETFNEFTIALASNYKIVSWGSIKRENLIANTKTALYYESPVVIGVNLTESFMNGSSLSYGKWSPKTGEVNIGGHAMCVIGYDDSKFGGSFEVMNSYGSDFGDNGFIWISYKDFADKVQEAYVLETQKYKVGACSFGDCLDSYSRYKFNNGDVYEGIVKSGELDVYGCYLYNDGSIYIGDWKKGRKHGYGLVYDVTTNKWYSTYYQNDVLVESAAKGFALSETDKKAAEKIEELKKTLPGELINDFEATQKALSKFEAPDKPIKIN
jgi:hypothetical protein